jgi:hypothetical protein
MSDVFCFFDEDEELFVCLNDDERGGIVVVSGTPANGYVAEDGTTFYVAEDGATFYVQEV